MPVLLEDPVSWLCTRLEAPGSRWLIALVGVPGAGKSTMATQWAAAVNARTAPHTMLALGMDGFHLPKAALRQFPDPELAFARRGAPWTFDVTALHRRLLALRAAAGREVVPWPGFDHRVGDPIEGEVLVPPETRLILVEGLYLLHQQDGWAEVSRCFDERWYLDTPLETALAWLAQRHMRAWDISLAAAEHRIATNDRLNAELVERSRACADWLVRVSPG